MRILDRYIIKSVLSIFFACLMTFFSLYIVIDVFANLENILKHKVELVILIQYYLSFLPLIFVQVSPIAALLSTLYTFANLNRSNEIIAMRSSGLSIQYITKTVITFGIIVSVFIFWINDKFVPQSNVLTEKIRAQMDAGDKELQEKEREEVTNLSMYGLKNRLFFVGKFSLAKGKMENIVILEHDEKQNIIKKIVANKGIYQDGLWRFYQCITYNFDENGQIRQEPQYLLEEIMSIPESPREFLSQRQRPDFMTIAQLDDYIWKLSKSGATAVIRNLKVDLYQRFTVPFTSVIIILLGIPFALRMKKRATGLSSLGISIMMGFLYYVLSAVSIALGKVGVFSPLLAASFSHMVALLLSFYLISHLP